MYVAGSRRLPAGSPPVLFSAGSGADEQRLPSVLRSGSLSRSPILSSRLDSLAAFMVMVISLLVTVSALYSLNYVQEYLGRGAWSMGFF